MDQTELKFCWTFLWSFSALLCSAHSMDFYLFSKSITYSNQSISRNWTVRCLLLLSIRYCHGLKSSSRCLQKLKLSRLVKMSACFTSALQSSSSNQAHQSNESSRRWVQLLKPTNCFIRTLSLMPLKSKQNEQKNTQMNTRWIVCVWFIRADAVLSCDESFVFKWNVNQKEKLLIVLGWQWFDVLFKQVQVPDCLVNDLLLGHFLSKKLWLFIVMPLWFRKHCFKMQIQL